MTFNQFTYVLKGRTLFRNGDVDVGDRRLSLWCSAGLIVRLAKGLYRLAKHDAYDPFELAALLSPRSYITSWSALEYCGFLSKSYRGPLISAHEGRAFEREIEGRVYRFLKIRNCESRQVVRYGEFSFAVADPPFWTCAIGESLHCSVQHPFDMNSLIQNICWLAFLRHVKARSVEL